MPLREVQELLREVRVAECINLSDEEAHLGKVSAEVCRVRKGLGQLEGARNVAPMAGRVQEIGEEVSMCVQALDAAKSEFARVRKWSCAGPKVTSVEWWSSWAAVLESLQRALERAPRP